MRKPALIALAIVIVLLLAATGVLYQRYRKTVADYTDAKTAEETAQSRYSEAVTSIAEIQDSLNAIVLGDTSVRLLSKELQTEQNLTQPDRREALDRIALIRASLERTKQRIHSLEAGLKKSGIRVAGLEKMIANLKQTVSEKEEFVGQLSGRVDSLQTTVNGLQVTIQQDQDTIQAQQQNIEEKRRDLATIYYVIGTKKDLTASGVVIAKGGVLGLGRTLLPSGRFDESLFTPLDTDQESVVRIPSVRVKVLSAQPAGSYELQLGDGQTELRILDRKGFRRVKHLVIMTG
jgi:type II secretory pathway pseudopilin PulG